MAQLRGFDYQTILDQTRQADENIRQSQLAQALRERQQQLKEAERVAANEEFERREKLKLSLKRQDDTRRDMESRGFAPDDGGQFTPDQMDQYRLELVADKEFEDEYNMAKLEALDADKLYKESRAKNQQSKITLSPKTKAFIALTEDTINTSIDKSKSLTDLRKLEREQGIPPRNLNNVTNMLRRMVITASGGGFEDGFDVSAPCLLYTSPSPRDRTRSRMPSSA